jgi:tetratricopeptide (TPR) repeat protein
VDFAGRVHGPASASVAEVLVRQARFLNGMRGFQEAAPRAAQGVEMLRATGSPDSVALARGLLALSVARTEMDDHAGAREAAEAAYALVSAEAARGASPGAEADGRGDPARSDTRLDDLDMAILSQLALLARRSGDVVEAERAYREMLALARETPDLDPGILAGLLNNLGMLLRTEGRGEEAEPLLRENLALMRSSQDPADRNLEVAATNLAALLWQLERFDETEALLREEAERVRGVFPAPHWRVANREGGLATFLERVGRWPEALPHRDAQVEGFEAALGADHSFTVQARIDRARVLVELGRLDEADRLLAECRAAIGRVSDIPDTSALAAAARAAGDRLAAARRGGEGAG